MAVGAVVHEAKAEERLNGRGGWDMEGVAQYLDNRIDMWFEESAKARSGKGRTYCVSCHTVFPYLIARPALRKAMGAKSRTPQEVKLLGEITRRVESRAREGPLYGGQEEPSRGTEAVLNALVLALEDSRQNREQMSDPARKAFKQLWEKQRDDGAWEWLDFGLEPDESRDARYYGAALAAIATGRAAGVARDKDENTVRHIERLRAYLKGNLGGQSLYNRAWALLASSWLEGLLSREQRGGLIAELQANQNGDGGWSLYRLGPWKWSRLVAPFSPPGKPDVSLLAKSDGYATGLIAYVLRHTGSLPTKLTLKKATDWLKANQREFQMGPRHWKLWRAHSLNHDRESGGVHGELSKRMVMSDAASAFAVLALVADE
jgi:hypothetical protein